MPNQIIYLHQLPLGDSLKPEEIKQILQENRRHPLLRVLMGLLGLALRGSMFANFLTLAQPETIRAGGTNQLYSGSELVEVATGLVIAVFSLLGMRHDWAADDASEDAGQDGQR